MIKRKLKWFLAVCLFLVVSYACIYGYRYQQYRAELAIYRNLGYPTNLDELRA